MTPLITNSISLAASFFDPGGRRYSHAIKKLIAEQVNLAEADSLREEQHLDRELGVGKYGSTSSWRLQTIHRLILPIASLCPLIRSGRDHRPMYRCQLDVW